MATMYVHICLSSNSEIQLTRAISMVTKTPKFCDVLFFSEKISFTVNDTNRQGLKGNLEH